MNRKMRFKEEIDATICCGISQEFSFNLSKQYIRSKKVLNIGCWTGGYEYFARDIASMIVGIDIGKRALQIAKKVSTANFIQASALNLPFRDTSFDVVTMWATIEHLPIRTESDALSEIYRVLKKGGIFCLSTPNSSFFSKILDPAYLLKDHRHYSKQDLDKLLTSTGFTIKTWMYKGGIFSCLFTIIFYSFKYLFNGKPPYFLNDLVRADYKPTCITNTPSKFGRDIFVVAKK
jgi:ubiquinone/menaquinone biosynthesis C-methylase UbiE